MRGRLRLLACQVFMAVAAGCFVGAFTIAALAPLGLTLADGVRRLDAPLLAAFERATRNRPGGWPSLMRPFLVRPAWMVPVMLGLISGGLAVTLNRQPRGGLPGKTRG